VRQTIKPVFLLHSSIQSKPAAGGFYLATAIISRTWTHVTALHTSTFAACLTTSGVKSRC